MKNFLDFFIQRPVFTSVFVAGWVLFGLMSLGQMPLREYPNIDRPEVTVSVKYPGASASLVEQRLAKVIEKAIGGVAGMDYMASSSTDGRLRLTLTFVAGTDIDAAANDVREKLSRILDNLPDGIRAPEVTKADDDNDTVMWLNLSSDRHNLMEISEFADDYLLDRFATIPGVAQVRLGGDKTPVVKIWLQPHALESHGLSPVDVAKALRAQNNRYPLGQFPLDTLQFTLELPSVFDTPEKLAQLILKQDPRSLSTVRLQDVARVTFEPIEHRALFRGNGEPMVGIGIIKQSDANLLSMAEGVKKMLVEVNKNLPQGMQLHPSYDSSIFVSDALAEVVKTLIWAVSLVVIVIAVFLRNLKLAMIPLVVLPVVLVANLFFMQKFGFSINLFTLMAFVLATGLIVDDLIVVMENIHRTGSPLEGTYQVIFAVIATTLVLLAVFIPLLFIPGDYGVLMTEFSMTLSSGVVLSSLMALTLVPVMQKKLSALSTTKPCEQTTTTPMHWHRFKASLAWALEKPLGFLAAALAIAFIGYFLLNQTPREYAPSEDRGVFFLNIKGPEGATYEYMEEKINDIEQRLAPIAQRGDVKRFLVRLPRAFSNAESFNNGFIIFVLNDWADRPAISKLIEETKQRTKDIQGVKIIPIQRRSLGPRTAKPVELAIAGPSWETLKSWRETLDRAIEKDNPGLTGMDWDLVENRPQWALEIDYEKAAALNLSLENLAQDLSILWGSQLTSRLQTQEKEYDIWMEIQPGEILQPSQLKAFRIKNRENQWVSLDQFSTWKESATSPSLAHFNRQRAISFDANLSPELSLGEALVYLENKIRSELPDTAQIYYKGQSRDYFQAADSGVLVFALALLIAYLALAAQFESWRHPLSLFLPLPLSFVGALSFMWIGNVTLNVYSQIALVLMIALMAKNGILIVEFANQLRRQGVELKLAIIESAVIRLRPILMTNLTTIAGVIPLVLAFGAGSEARQAIGWTILGGMLMSLVISLYFVPVTYYQLEKKFAIKKQIE